MRLLDLFCGAGGAAMGYHQAGFIVLGVDIKSQPNYPFEFYQADALEFCTAHGHEFDLIHASPPCQAYSQARHMQKTLIDHPDLIAVTRKALLKTKKPFVIENVIGTPLNNPLMLCGTMFNLGVIRHRLFETFPTLWWPPAPCQHEGLVLPMWWRTRCRALQAGKKFRYITVAGDSFSLSKARVAMEINWMTRVEIAQAIPPSYTRWIGIMIQRTINQ